ncbi:MAG: glycosyltransferase family 9 protein [Verrucomicrobiota bacterium JB022]|nr:glycosyltransferase family 9 protein [Verrucomicrobiota bacterium JB022]
MTTAHQPVAYRFGGMADQIMLLPALARLQRSYGMSPLLIHRAGWSDELLAEQWGEVRILRPDRLPYWLNPSQQALVKELREIGPAPAYLFGDAARLYPLLELAGLQAGDIIDARHYPRGPREHQVAYQLRLASQCPPRWQSAFCADAPLRELPAPVLQVDDRQRRECLSWLTGRQWDDRPFILIQPGTHLTQEEEDASARLNCRWPERHWAAVIDTLSVEAEGARFLLCGTPEDLPYHRRILDLCRYRRVASLAEGLTASRLLPLLEYAHSMISVSAGPAHAAAAVNCPLVAIFGRTDPHRERPLARQAPVLIATPQGLDWIRWAPGEVEPELVVQAWRELVRTHPWPASHPRRRAPSRL